MLRSNLSRQAWSRIESESSKELPNLQGYALELEFTKASSLQMMGRLEEALDVMRAAEKGADEDSKETLVMSQAEILALLGRTEEFDRLVNAIDLEHLSTPQANDCIDDPS